jgi:hypothetical protein
MPLFFNGPSGGVGGWGYNDEKQFPSTTPNPEKLEDVFVTTVDIRHGLFIDSIQLRWQSKNRAQTYKRHHGGPGGAQLGQIQLNRNQTILGISGAYGRFVDSLAIIVLDLGTGATTTHGPFGGPGGDVGFEYMVPFQGTPDSAIVGFWGGAGRFIDSIGIIMRRPL